MNFKEIDAIAKALKALSEKKLYVCAHAYPASGVKPKDYILVEGIKNLRSTGRLTFADRHAIANVISKHIKLHNGELKHGCKDPCMFIEIITF